MRAVRTPGGVPTPNDPWFVDQLAVDGGTPGCRADKDLNLLAAWRELGWPQKRLEGHDVYVAVIDTGVDLGAAECAKVPSPKAAQTPTCKAYLDLGQSIVERKDVGGSSSADPGGHPHGTQVASIVAAAANNEVAMAGVLPGCRIISCKVAAHNSDHLHPEHVVECLKWINELKKAKKYNVVAVNLSIGETVCLPAMESEIRELRKNGVLVVAAAGKGKANNDSPASCPFFPASFPVSNVISVGATHFSDQLEGRSGKRSVHVVAPVHHRDSGDVMAIDPKDRDNHLRSTSAATALVSGLIALLKAEKPERDWITLRNLVLAGGVPVAGLRDRIITGRRICAADTRGLGSMTCSNQRVQRRVLPRLDALTMPKDQGSLRIVTLSIKCAFPEDPRPVEVMTDDQRWQLPLNDDGRGPDEWPHDGEYAALWTPPVRGRDYLLKFADPADSLQVKVE